MSYVKQTSYLGKDGKVIEEKGFYTRNSEGNTITLNGIENAPNQYFVGVNKLIQLDMNGKRIAGNMADKYILLR
jgi:copper homeostasis protein (lipoprotein)